MKASVCITVYNEEKSVRKLLESLLNQTQKPSEIIVVDGGSTDKTVQIIRHLQKKNKRIRLLVQQCTRAKGRNLSVELARSKIIAITDADCKADKNWLKRITEPFKHKSVGIVAGFYKMITKTPIQKAFSVFLGVMPDDFSPTNFLPSTRSIAFRKKVWEQIGGFPEGEDNSAEDTDFNYQALKLGVKYTCVKNARVEWNVPADLKTFLRKIYSYAKWDIKYGIWKHPTKGLASHNIKALSIFSRYLFEIVLLVLCLCGLLIPLVPLMLLILYLLRSFNKVHNHFGEVEAGLWGIVVQILSDFAVMGGFLVGLKEKVLKRT